MAYEIELDVGWTGKKLFSIDEESLIFHDTQMMCKDIVSFAYGGTLTSVMSMKANTEHKFAFRDSSDDELQFSFLNTALFDTNPKDASQRIISETWLAFGNRIRQEVIDKLARGQVVQLCELSLHSTGVNTKKPVFGSATDHLVPWEELEYNMEEGVLSVRSASDSKVNAKIWASGWDAQLLWSLLNSISDEAGVLEKVKRVR